ncbi:unnamed protein product [Menidia menidia]|uniref:(Atlantic silverside) hypothetical protein n=1 Tax=Menidia menidia TaxID=238744 RepID=A0A8S4ALZ1_9TELE|nr:unnamed protein product [Menidia menidia]
MFPPLDSITITHKDSRWVGAWWLGFIVTGTVILLSSIPFFFLPKSLPKQGQKRGINKATELTAVSEQEGFLPEEEKEKEDKEEKEEKAVSVQEMDGDKATELAGVSEQEGFLPEEEKEKEDKEEKEEKAVSVQEMVKDFVPSLRRLFRNSIFSMMILTYLVSVNGFIGMITFKPKFMEQIYGQSASKAIFLIGREYQNQTSTRPEPELFLVSLAFVYFAKAFCGAYLKSSITQIERRFDIPSSLIGVIDGSFEMGNLLVIAFVSYFGAKLHRPKLIGIGCLIMSVGSFLIAMPHFFQGPSVLSPVFFLLQDIKIT